MHNDLDLGVIAVVWKAARELLMQTDDVGISAQAALMRAAFTSDKELRKIGRKARRGGVHRVIAILNGGRAVRELHDERKRDTL